MLLKFSNTVRKGDLFFIPVTNAMKNRYKFLLFVSKLEWSNANHVTMQISNLNTVMIDWVRHEVSCVNLQINTGVLNFDRTVCYCVFLTKYGVLI
jgi:hypothetical protein